jgi:hypothetical protein
VIARRNKINDFDSVSYDIFTPTLSHLTKAQAPRSTLPPEDIMFIIFNLAGVSFCVLALFGGWGVQFAAWALGFDESAKDLSDLDLSHRLTGLPTRENVHMSKPMATYSDILAALHDVERSGGSFWREVSRAASSLGHPSASLRA